MTHDLTEFVDDELLGHDIESRKSYGVDPHADTEKIVKPGENGGIRHAVAPLERWILIAGMALAFTAVGMAVLTLSWLIAMSIDYFFWHIGQWSAT